MFYYQNRAILAGSKQQYNIVIKHLKDIQVISQKFNEIEVVGHV